MKNYNVYWQPCLLATHSEILKACRTNGFNNLKKGKNMKCILTFSQPYGTHWYVSLPSEWSQSEKYSGWQNRMEDDVSTSKTVFWYSNQIISISVIHPCSQLSGDHLSKKGKSTVIFHGLHYQLIVLSIS